MEDDGDGEDIEGDLDGVEVDERVVTSLPVGWVLCPMVRYFNFLFR